MIDYQDWKHVDTSEPTNTYEIAAMAIMTVMFALGFLGLFLVLTA